MKKKIILAFLLMTVMGFTHPPISQAGVYDSTVAIAGYTTTDGIYEDAEHGLTWNYKLNTANDGSGTDKITDLTCTVSNPFIAMISPLVTVPEKINGVEVTELGNGAFKENTVVQEIVIPDSITRICSEAFSGCSILKKVSFGSNVNLLGDKAFYNCKAITEITIGSDLINGNFGTYAFSGCSALEKVVIENAGTVTIPEGTFENCSNLKNLNILNENSASSDLKIGEKAFYNTGFKNLYFNGNTTLGNAAFSNCKNLENVTFKKDAVLLKEAFSDSFQSAETSGITFSGNGEVTLGSSALKNVKIKAVNFENTLSNVILDDGCLNNASITSLNIEGKKTLVRKNAFTGVKASSVVFNSTEKTEIVGDMFEKDNSYCKVMEFNSKTVSFAETGVNQNRVFNSAKSLKTLKFKENTSSILGKLTGACYVENVYIYNPNLVSEWKKDTSVSNAITCYTYLNDVSKVSLFSENDNCNYKDVVKSLEACYVPDKAVTGAELVPSDFSVQANLQDNSTVAIKPSLDNTDTTGFVLNTNSFESVGSKKMEIQFYGKKAEVTVNVIAATPTPTRRPTNTPTPTLVVRITATPGVTVLPTNGPTKAATPTPTKKVEKTVTPTPTKKAEKTVTPTPTVKVKKAVTPKVTVKINNKKQNLYKKSKSVMYTNYVSKLEIKFSVQPKKTKIYYQIVKKGKKITEKGWKKAGSKIKFNKDGKYCVYVKYSSNGKNLVQKTKGFYIDTIIPTVDINVKTHKLKAKDKGSGIAYIKVNGKKVSNGYILPPGTNDIVVEDKAGNKKKVHCEL